MEQIFSVFNNVDHFPIASDLLQENKWLILENTLSESADVVFFHLPTLLDSLPDELVKEDHQLWIGWKYEDEYTNLWFNPELDVFFDFYIRFDPRLGIRIPKRDKTLSPLMFTVLRIGNAILREKFHSIPCNVPLNRYLKYKQFKWKRFWSHPLYFIRQSIERGTNNLRGIVIFPFWKKVGFMLIGTQKGGTTALHEYLCQHPRCLGSGLKEPMFFLYPCIYALGMKWYKKLWLNFHSRSKIPLNCLLFESSTWYSYWHEVPQKLYQYNSRLKFIFLIRNPIDRAYSHYNMLIKRDKKQLLYEYHLFKDKYNVREFVDQLLDTSHYSFAYWANVEMKRYRNAENTSDAVLPDFLHRGIYYRQLERFYQYFDKEQILVIDSKDLKNNRITTLERIENFLNIPHIDWSSHDLEDKHVSSYNLPFPKEIRQSLQAFYKPYNEKLYKMVGYDLGWN